MEGIMHIKQKISQYRRDFTAEYECEHCGGFQRGSGYDDAYFHEYVIPSMVCATCGKRAAEATSTADVPEGAVI